MTLGCYPIFVVLIFEVEAEDLLFTSNRGMWVLAEGGEKVRNTRGKAKDRNDKCVAKYYPRPSDAWITTSGGYQ